MRAVYAIILLVASAFADPIQRAVPDSVSDVVDQLTSFIQEHDPATLTDLEFSIGLYKVTLESLSVSQFSGFSAEYTADEETGKVDDKIDIPSLHVELTNLKLKTLTQSIAITKFSADVSEVDLNIDATYDSSKQEFTSTTVSLKLGDIEGEGTLDINGSESEIELTGKTDEVNEQLTKYNSIVNEVVKVALNAVIKLL